MRHAAYGIGLRVTRHLCNANGYAVLGAMNIAIDSRPIPAAWGRSDTDGKNRAAGCCARKVTAMADTRRPCLFIVLGTKPSVHLLEEPSVDELEISDKKYRLLDREIGFYDFLRTKGGAIIGIRMSPFDSRPLIDYADALDYIYVDPVRVYLEIYLREYRRSADGPAEQAFGDDAIWRNSQGTYALQLGTGELSEGDLDVLRESVRVGE
jgi:hypothetical protein